MTLRLYDTATRSVRDFVPQEPGKVGIYLCGLTVQSPPHIGHLRSGVNYDVLRRWFLHTGYEVTFIRNITDIDDKILAKSVEQGRPFWSIAYTNEVILGAAYRTLNVLPPTYEPRATGHILEMQELIQKLIADGHAYPAEDGSGDVYFDVLSYPEYGALSGQHPEAMLSAGQRPEAMQAAGDAPDRGKRDPRDFALWKGIKPEEPADASWPSPWGPGRPGWHIECSAMCRRYLGAEFDIHGGGVDLTFPHHENEIAQSKAAGLPFARYWVHHGLLNLGETKMSKSLGNVLDLVHVAALGIRPVELRYYLVAPHYRSRIDYSDESLREAAVAYRRIEGFVRRAAERLGPGEIGGAEGVEGFGDLPAAFGAALDDDLNTSAALAVLHDTVRDGNLALADGDDAAAGTALVAVRGMLDILGVDPLDESWSGDGQEDSLRGVVDALIALALEQRTQARARKDWAAADAVRDQLKQAGVVVEDTPQGPRWTIGEQD
ncbi:cysteine--tRNA ligase [Micromonospora polyrhachis]|uniref:Cysteine--tRNA ligase n=1 Tax=Micromonospora polyrhachis TaxID=1282883 RepID=A0A7W7SRN0_9ACTN|nr:cysteine--tRNA ligase [Micromonospora polyrhachis]MBB4959556.1 cysteinyl-tRNA synthetase [Micromonospora polyrhachis]